MKLSIQPQLLADESLDSYVEYLADIHHCRPQLFTTTPYEQNAALGLTVGRSANPSILTELAALTDTSYELLLAATTSRYDFAGLHAGDVRADEQSWGKKGFCSFCPQCLNENQLRWFLPWYLRWTNICTQHNVVLVDACPTCARRARSSGTHHPRRRESPTSQWNAKRCEDSCATEALATSHANPIDPNSRAFANQRWITRVVDDGGGQCPYNGGEYLSARTILKDLTILTRQALLSAVPILDTYSIPGSHADGEWAATIGSSEIVNLERGRRGLRAVGTPFFLLAQTAAIDLLLTSPDSDLRMTWLTKERADRTVGSIRRSTKTSPSAALERMLGVVRGFRGGQSTVLSDSMGRRRVQHSFRALKLTSSTSIDAAQLPATTWPEVTRNAPLLPPRVARTFPHVGTIALAGIGRDPDHSKLAAQFGYSISEKHARRALDNLIANELGSNALGYLAVLHSHLLQCPPPIDYRRRRRLWPAPSDIGRNHTRQLARAGDCYLTAAFRWKIQRFVWQLLTGNDPYITQGVALLHGPAAYAYRQFLDAMAPDLFTASREVAERLLLKQRIDEPVTYEPIFDTTTQTWKRGSTRHSAFASGRTDLRQSSNSLALAASAAGDAEELVHLALAGEKVTALRLRNFVDTAHCSTNIEMAESRGVRRTQIVREISFLNDSLGAPILRKARRDAPQSLTNAGERLLELAAANIDKLREIAD